jgi:putative spermidine/putrescine transport system ATP-binding protein
MHGLDLYGKKHSGPSDGLLNIQAGHMTAPFISFQNVSKQYGTLTVVDDLNLDIAKGEFVSLLGPSGSGKTTILMMLAGFEATSTGSVFVDGKRIDQLPPHRRNMGVVFQNYALFPHRTVRENVGFPLRMRGMARAEIQSRVNRALDMVQLSTMADRKPGQLSGGQQQRVALARALVFEPEVVLMDEPLGALDKQLREQMQLDIRELHHRLGLTIVFVTHDQGEALTMSDRIAVFNKGRIEHIGTPTEIYDHPRTPFVAQFIGETNLINGETTSQAGRSVFRTPSGIVLPLEAARFQADLPPRTVSVRPERVRIAQTESTGPAFEATIGDIVYHGDHLRVLLKVGEEQIVARSERSNSGLTVGQSVQVSVEASDVWGFADVSI